jgi:hypothetical protein
VSPVEIYILEQPPELQPILKKLRYLILSASPQLEEKMVYKIPFFYCRKRILYLNPLKGGVDLGFCDGFMMGENQLLENKNRTQVRTIRFSKIADIDDESIIPLIHEAILIDQLRAARKS